MFIVYFGFGGSPGAVRDEFIMGKRNPAAAATAGTPTTESQFGG